MHCKTSIKGRSVVLEAAGRPLIMGIVNVTPDSFSDGGRFLDTEDAFQHAKSLMAEGADLLDIGGESTRPGALAVSAHEELDRVIPLIRRWVAETSIPVSIDTSKALVAEASLDAGAEFVNDVSALKGDALMAQTVRRSGAGVILMHMQGSPRTMQDAPHYAGVVDEVSTALQAAAADAESQGIVRDKIVLDPGIGFGKNLGHNLSLIKHIADFKALGYAILLGASRKSFMGEVLNASVSKRLAGSLAVAAWAYQTGVDIVRVHDVKETRQVFEMLKAIENAK